MALGRKNKTAFFCSQCGAEHPRWQGQCRECNQWNCLIEENVPARRSETTRAASAEKKTIPEIEPIGRSGFRSGINEFDRVLGGQLLPGTAVLLGGEPGIGKSTLLLQLAEAYSRENLPVLYVTGEESLPQIKQRAERLQIVGTKVTVVNTTSLEEIIELVGKNDFRVVLVDSIQTVASSQFDSPPGTVAQVRESAGRLISLAKANDIALFLVGHITKDGMVAGPKVLEHMVDTVVYFEGDRTHLYRMLRPTKNRYGPITEVGIFEMMPQGLVEVANPSSLFLADHGGKARSGSVVTSICEGSRPILVEIQALVTAANYGNPQRVAGGTDNKRLALLLAI
ncbi:MAG: DNA repair protein RadA, partial [candidate division Zixibacteria bacterium]|nr:DNA repair protein RadA [candidate division Zixibacteria bacterium]